MCQQVLEGISEFGQRCNYPILPLRTFDSSMVTTDSLWSFGHILESFRGVPEVLRVDGNTFHDIRIGSNINMLLIFENKGVPSLKWPC